MEMVEGTGAFKRVAYRVSMPKDVYEGVAGVAHAQDRSVHMQLIRCIKIGLEVEQARPVESYSPRPRRRRRKQADEGDGAQV